MRQSWKNRESIWRILSLDAERQPRQAMAQAHSRHTHCLELPAAEPLVVVNHIALVQSAIAYDEVVRMVGLGRCGMTMNEQSRLNTSMPADLRHQCATQHNVSSNPTQKGSLTYLAKTRVDLLLRCATIAWRCRVKDGARRLTRSSDLYLWMWHELRLRSCMRVRKGV